MATAAAQDVWALGVVAFEAIAQRQALPSIRDIRACAAGTEAYPWQLPPEAQPPAWRESRLRRALAPCLERDPAARPSAAALAASVSSMGQATTLRA